MKIDLRIQGLKFKENPHILYLRGFLLVVMLLIIFSFTMGCKKKEEAPPPPPVVEQKTPAPTQTQTPNFHSILIKDLTQLIPATSFSKNDRIYLHTVWTGLQGDHEIKVLWIRPDKTVQETTRFKVEIPPNTPNYITWAWLSFKKGLLDFLPAEGKFIGSWKAQLFLDGRLMADYSFVIS